MQRGQFVLVAVNGDYGKPLPALVVQSDLFAELPSVVVCPLSSTEREDADEFRIEVVPTPENGLRLRSQISIDKITTVPVTKIGGVTGRADEALLIRVNRALAIFLGIV